MSDSDQCCLVYFKVVLYTRWSLVPFVNISCELEPIVITRAVIPANKFHPYCHMKVAKQLHITALMN